MSNGLPPVCDVLVIGAGAAGMLAAATAAARGRHVVLVDHGEEPGRKILISGGGRCNFTHLDTRPECFLSANRHFARSALARYTARDFLTLVERHRIPWHEKTAGQLFCDRSARDIVSMLLEECAQAQVRCVWPLAIRDVTREGDAFTVRTDRGTIDAASVVLATGGLAIPKLGASDFSLRMAQRFGLRLVETDAALVPLTRHDHDPALAGISLDIRASIGKIGFTDGLVFTHRGLSGPAILQISSYWRMGVPLRMDLLPGRDAFALLRAARAERPRARSTSLLTGLVPQRLAAWLLEEGADRIGPLPDVTLGNVSDSVLTRVADGLQNRSFDPTGSEGYAKAEVMRGGIDTRDLDQKTMQARDVPGLFVVGEAVDVTGWLGGHNFQWAWSSGHAAGSAA